MVIEFCRNDQIERGKEGRRGGPRVHVTFPFLPQCAGKLGIQMEENEMRITTFHLTTNKKYS